MLHLPLSQAARLCAAAHSGSVGARKRLPVARASACTYLAPTKADAARFTRDLSGATLKAATEAVALAIEAYKARPKGAPVGDVLWARQLVRAGGGPTGRSPALWASVVHSAKRIGKALGLRDALVAGVVDPSDCMYSGSTSVALRYAHGSAHAHTETSKGETYSRACTWRKTDAVHHVETSPQAVLRLSRAVASGLPLRMAGMVHLDAVPAGEGRYVVAVAKRGRGKTVACERGLFAQRMAEGDWFHASSERAIVAEVRRRAKGVEAGDCVRALFAKKSITVAACRRLGWCEPGIRAWVARWMADADKMLEARKAPRAVVRAAAERAAASGDYYGAKLLALVA